MPGAIAPHKKALGILFLLLCLPIAAADTSASQPMAAKTGARLAIIIDDLGYNLRLGQRSADLPGAFTIAVLPFTPHGRELAERAHQRGKEIMLHAPMSNHHRYPLGRGGLESGMQQAEFLAVLRANLANIPHIKGVNNHMGSQLTEQAEPMAWLMAELKTRQLYFVDSRTSARTQALLMAEKIDLPSRRRDVFLDDQQDQQLIYQQLLVALKKAQRQGSAIAIGHPYAETLAVLDGIQPLLVEYGVSLVKASELMPAVPTGFSKTISHCMAPPARLWPSPWTPIDPFNNPLIQWPN